MHLNSPASIASSPRSHVILLLAVAALVLLPGNRSIPLLDRDEPRFAQATVEMIESGNWIVPHFNGQYRFDKPVLTYWVMSLGYALFGPNEFGARFHSAVFAALVALLLYGLGRRWFDPVAGLLAGVAWLTSLQVVLHGRSAVADQPMVFFVVLAQWGLFELLYGERPGHRTRWFWLTYGGLGLGFLAKGPIAVLVPALTLVLHRLIGREPVPWRRLRLAAGLPVVLLLVGAWGVPALWQTGGAFWGEGMNRHVVERGFKAFNSRAFLPLVYYPVTALFSLFPWAAFFGVVVGFVRRNGSLQTRFLIAWALAPVLIFSLYATQLPHYILPGFPAFLLLVGAALREFRFERRWHRSWFAGVVGLGALLCLGALAVSILWPLPVLGDLRLAVLGMAVILAGQLGLAWMARTGRCRPFPLALLAAGPLLMAAGLRPTNIAVQLQEAFVERTADTAFATHRFREPSLVFYSNRRWGWFGEPSEITTWNAENDDRPRLVVTLDREVKLDRLLRRDRSGVPAEAGRSYPEDADLLERLGFRRERTVEGLNTARSTWVVVSLWTSVD